MLASNQTSNLTQSQLNLNNSQLITHFEILPNELLYSIFNYIEIDDLYNSFSGLNSRFNTLINSISHCYLQLKATTELGIIDKIASTIKHIHVKKKCLSISLTPFRDTLCSLTFDLLTKEYMDQLHTLDHLKYLEIKAFPTVHLIKNLEQFLASSSRINHLVLPYWCLENTYAGRHFSFQSIQSLRFSNLTKNNDFVHQFGTFPNLIRLHIHICYIQTLPSIYKPLSNVLYGLTYFNLQLSVGVTDSQLDFYLIHVPNIKSFRFLTSPCLVYSNQRGPYYVLNSIADLIEKRLRNLQRFLCIVTFEIKSNDPFDIGEVHTIYNQRYSIELKKNRQIFRSKWIKN